MADDLKFVFVAMGKDNDERPTPLRNDLFPVAMITNHQCTNGRRSLASDIVDGRVPFGAKALSG